MPESAGFAQRILACIESIPAGRVMTYGVQSFAGENERAARNQRSDNSPEQHPVLQFARHLEISEDHQEHKEIVDAERKLNEVAGRELQAGRAPVPPVDAP